MKAEEQTARGDEAWNLVESAFAVARRLPLADSDANTLRDDAHALRRALKAGHFRPGSRVREDDEARVHGSMIRKAMDQTREMADPHRYHMLCAKLMALLSAYGPCHDHIISEPCTPDCPAYDPAYDTDEPAPPTLKGEDDGDAG